MVKMSMGQQNTGNAFVMFFNVIDNIISGRSNINNETLHTDFSDDVSISGELVWVIFKIKNLYHFY